MACSTLIICAMLAMRTAIGVAREDVQVERGQDGVTEAVLLHEEAGLLPGSGAYQPPLVDD